MKKEDRRDSWQALTRGAIALTPVRETLETMKSAVSGQPDKSRCVCGCLHNASRLVHQRALSKTPGRLAGLQRQKLGGRPRRDRGGGYVVELTQGLPPCRRQWLQHSPAGPGDITLCTRELTKRFAKVGMRMTTLLCNRLRGCYPISVTGLMESTKYPTVYVSRRKGEK